MTSLYVRVYNIKKYGHKYKDDIMNLQKVRK